MDKPKTTYKVIPFEEVKNENGVMFYELLVNGKSHVREFIDSIPEKSVYRKRFYNMVALMDNFSPTHFMPNTKFRPIEGSDECFEFKAKGIRLYVLKRLPNMYVVIGGYKDDQKADIKKLKRLIKDF